MLVRRQNLERVRSATLMKAPRTISGYIRRCALFVAVYVLVGQTPGFGGDWPMYGHDPARSGWASEENILNTSNASQIHLLWKEHVKNQPYSLSALTAPVVVGGVSFPSGTRSVAIVAGVGGTVFALDAETGDALWNRPLASMTTPRKGGFQGTFLCPNGITATPVIDKVTNTLYVIAPEGELYGLDLRNGRVKYGPVPFVAPYAKSWSLNLVDHTVYTTVSLGCGGGRAGIYAADVRDPHQTGVRELFLSNAFTAGIWGRSGLVMGGDKLYGGTADGDTSPSTGDYSNTVVAVSSEELSVSDYFLPSNFAELKHKDLDVGSASPVWFSWRDKHLVADGFKEGVVYLLDADKLGGVNHQTPLFASPRLGNDEQICCAANGIWGALSTSRDATGETWLYVPMGGPPSAQAPKFPLTNGDNPHGSIMAFKVTENPVTHKPVLKPGWMSSDFHYPDPVAIANGVAFALSNGENPDQRNESKRFLETRPAVLKALDATTGRELYNSRTAIDTWAHSSGIAISDGHIYAVDHDSNLYCFGLEQRKLSSKTSKVSAQRAPDELSNSWIGRAERPEEFMRSWLLRAGVCAALAFLLALAGIWAALRHERLSNQA